MAHKLWFLIFYFILEVRSMALKGPALTRYIPCGLGLLHFDKLSENNWQGVLNFGLYTNMIAAEVVIGFKNETTVSVHRINNVTTTRTNKYNLIVHAMTPIPQKYIFYVALDNFKANKSDVPVVTILTLNNVTLCDEKIKASQTINSLNVTRSFAGKYYAHVCGRRAFDHGELVSVRTHAKAGDWPWHVAIFIRDQNNVLKYECGGNVVSKTAILTAGHCVYKNGALLDTRKIVIVAGTVNHNDITHIGRQAFNAAEVILHPAYHTDHSTSDLAIIKVNNLQFTEYVQPICLWGLVYEKRDLFGKEATVVGFGATEFNMQSDVLRSTNTVVQNDTTCNKFAPKVYTKLLNEFTFCAGYGPTSSINPRNGDSGGGLVLPTIQADHKISWFLRGVLSKCGVSPGHKECDPTYYVIYTDIAPHYGWIYHHAGLQFRSNVVPFY